MTTLRFRLNFIAMITIAAMSFCLWKGWYGMKEWERTQSNIRQTDELRSLVLDLAEQPFDEELSRRLSRIRAQLQPVERQKQLSEVIEIYNQRLTDEKELRKRVKTFFNSEGTFVRR
ncbi:MAG: hypothetical protein V4760_16570, partial [Bdellovibrionota bacterium]